MINKKSKIMKNLYFIFIAILFFTACNKDSIVIDKKTEIDPPVEIDGAFIKGIVTSITGDKLEGVAIDIYQDNKKIGRTFSGNNGKYSTHSIPLNPEKTVTVKYSKDNFENKYRRFDFDETTKYEKDIIMGFKPDSGDVKLTDFELTNPSDTSYIKLYGYAKLADGTPVAGVKCTALWEYQLFSFPPRVLLLIKEYTTDYSDADGYFELLVPRNKDIYFNAEKTRYPDQLLSCIERFSYLDPDSELNDYSFQKLGAFDMDTEVQLKDDIVFETISSHVTGKAYRCDGTPVAHGTLIVGITILNWFPIVTKKIENYEFGPNGEFSVDLETCPPDNPQGGYKILVNIKDTDVNFFNVEQFEYNEYADIGQINLCYDDNDYPDDFEMTLGTLTRQYPQGGDDARSGENNLQTGFYYKDGDYEEAVFLIIDNIHTGIVPVTRFEMWKINKHVVYETTFKAKPEDVTVTITKIEDKYVYGNLTGNVNTPEGRKPVSATFKIYNK